MNPLASMQHAVQHMERARAAFVRAREQLEPTVMWACCNCLTLSPEPVCSPECEAEMRRYEGRQP